MQLEAKMKQRFSWTALLLLTACLVHSSLATVKDGTCVDSVGIIGKFSQGDELDSLTITPIEYKNTLEVTINQKDPVDRSIQIYMLLDQDSPCTDMNFDIVHPDGSAKCSFKYTVNKDAHTLTMDGKQARDFDYADPYQASFEVQVEGSTPKVAKVIVQTSSGDSDDDLTVADCLQFDEKEKATRFKLSFSGKFGGKDEECGVQFEMKGAYAPELLAMDDNKNCSIEPGFSNDDAAQAETSSNPDAQPTTESSFPTWAWYAIGGGLLALIVVIIIIVLVIVCIRKKKGSADEDLEAAPEEEPDFQPTESTTTGPGAEPSGVDPTQQPEDKSEDKSEDKPEDKPEDKEDE